jgi:uncharacterized membrane protein
MMHLTFETKQMTSQLVQVNAISSTPLCLSFVTKLSDWASVATIIASVVGVIYTLYCLYTKWLEQKRIKSSEEHFRNTHDQE